jgi:mercuric ion binding protein
MKKLLFLMFALAIYQVANAQEKKSNTETVIIKTSAQCGDCKERIEEALNYTKGVKFSELDLETKNVTVKFLPAKITLQQIKEKISSIGYDADEVKSNPAAVKKLPACCQPGGMKQ